MAFIIRGLPAADFEPLFGLPDAALAARGILRRIADQDPGFPCRVSLRDASVGEAVLLLNHEHLPVASPYRSRYAIYVREHAQEHRPEVDAVPLALRTRLLSVRAFDAAGMLLEAEVVAGLDVAPVIEGYLAQPQIDYLHLHHAKPGCYAARVDRA